MKMKRLQTNVSDGNKEEEERVGVVIEIRELGTPNDPPAIAAILKLSFFKIRHSQLLVSLHLLPQTKSLMFF